MPTYEYVCKACGEHLEVVQAFDDTPLSACPACGGTLRKVFGNVGIVFKGSGFYKTDSRTSWTAGASAKGDGTSSSSEAAPAAAKEPAGSTAGGTASPGSTPSAGAGSGSGSGSGSASSSTPSAAAG